MSSISVKELKEKLKEFVIVDVREPDETSQGTIQDAKAIPLGKLMRDVGKGVITFPKDKPIVCYCGSGIRGSIAVDFLQKKGYNALNLEGGYSAWVSA